MKNIKVVVKIYVESCKASPVPPIGSILGSKGINVIDFCNKFNDITKKKKILKGTSLPVIVTIYNDRSFDFIIKEPAVSVLMKMILKLDKFSGKPNKNKFGVITKKQIENLVNLKSKDLYANSKKNAIKMIVGSIKSSGVLIK